jgi:8-oxo-dGTP pyrophosphatase MutT (NUDIX family)
VSRGSSEPISEGPPPRAASTLVLLRDGDGGVEAFMLKRHGQDDVLAGAYVFPGGKVDREDAEADSLARLGQSPELLHRRLGEQALAHGEAASIFMAAYRETFEETGVLLAAGADDPMAERATAMRREGFGFIDVLQHFDLWLDASALHPWSRWITPKVPSMMRKRFDTRFFVGRLPPGQRPRPDAREAVDGEWLVPRDALVRYWDGHIDLAAPQIMTLAHLSRFQDVESVLTDAVSRPPPLVQPEPFEVEGGRMICYPGDERHPVTVRAMPGPTRMLFAGGRFRPVGGLESWFD